VSILKLLRIATLAVVLVFVAGVTFQAARSATAWEHPLRVTVYPVAADGSPAAAAWLASLDVGHFAPIEQFFRREAGRYPVDIDQPVAIRVGRALADPPPPPPVDAGALGIAAWSLRLRFWAWRALSDQPGPRPQVRMFALYHDPAVATVLPDSVGLQKGLIGIVHGFAATELAGMNAVVFSHELLHTLGASDKYDRASNLPLWPDGYAEPAREPLHPQPRAELMAGRVAIGPADASLPDSLAEVVIGPATAREIRWTR
jgi:hypothetical protein